MPGPLLDYGIQFPTAPVPLTGLASVGALQNLRNTQIQNQLTQADLRAQATQRAALAADAQAQADQRTRDNADQNTIQERMKDPDFAHSVASWDGTSAFPLDGLVSPKAARDAQTAILAQQKERAVLTDTQRKANDALHEKIGETVNGLAYDETGQKRSDADIASLAPGAFAQLVKDGQLKPENVPAVTNWNDLNTFAVKNRYVQGLGQAASTLKDAAGKPLLQTAQTDEATGKANEANANAANKNALTPGQVAAEATKNDIAAADATFRKAHGGLSAVEFATNNVAKGHLSVAQAAETRQNKEFIAKYGDPGARAAFTESVKRDPDSYFSLSPEMKVGVAHDLVAQGLNVPVQLPSDLKTRAVSADLGLKAINRIRELLQDPDIVGSVGPISGRLGNVEQAVGDTYFGQGSAQATKEQELRTNFSYLKLLEAKGLLGGRPASTLIGNLSAVTANPKMAPNLINGSLNAMTTNLDNVKDEAKRYAFGGASNSPTDAGALPAAAKAQLKEGQDTTFGNGQVWTLTNGKESRVK